MCPVSQDVPVSINENTIVDEQPAENNMFQVIADLTIYLFVPIHNSSWNMHIDGENTQTRFLFDKKKYFEEIWPSSSHAF